MYDNSNDPDEFDKYVKKVKAGEVGKSTTEAYSESEELRIMRKMLELMTSQELRGQGMAKNIRTITTIYVLGVVLTILYALLLVGSMFK